MVNKSGKSFVVPSEEIPLRNPGNCRHILTRSVEGNRIEGINSPDNMSLMRSITSLTVIVFEFVTVLFAVIVVHGNSSFEINVQLPF